MHATALHVLHKRLAALRMLLVLRGNEWKLRAQLAVAVEIRRLNGQIELQNLARSRVLLSSYINVLSDQECLMRYRFFRKDVGFISGLIPWESSLHYHGRIRTRRRRYRIDPVEATAIFLPRLATDSRWVDVQDEFGKHSACLTEISYHTIELFNSKFGEHITTWPFKLLQERAAH
jgi:hypothetical protein